jgi:hypothetical protein
LDVINECAFAISLSEFQFDVELASNLAQPRLDVGERLASVELGLARAEEV